MRYFNSRLLMLVLAGSLAASTALGQTAPQPTITSVLGSYIGTTSPMATSVTAGVTGLELTVTGTNFVFPDGGGISQLVWIPSGGCPVGSSCVFPIVSYSWLTAPVMQFTADIDPALIANADPGATVMVQNPGNIDSAPFPFPVNPPLSIATLPPAYVNVPYAAYLTNGGTPPYNTDGSVPAPGMSTFGALIGGGEILGTPTLLGTFSGQLAVVDAWGQAAPPNTYTLNVSAALPAGVQGVPYAVQSPFVGGPYTLLATSGSLPPGISITLANGVLSIAGTPTAAGAYSEAIEIDSFVSDVGIVVVATGTIAINIVLPVSITTLSLGVIPPSGVFSASVAAQNGIPPYTWFVSSGNLPTGLTLNPSTGLISGTATGKGTTFTILVTDQTVVTASRTYTLDFQLQLSPATLPTGLVGTNYSQSLSVTGGSGSFTCSVSQGTLPPPLVLSSQCSITGTPSTAGSFPFTVRVADGVDGQILTQPYTVNIVLPVSITTLSLGVIPPSGVFSASVAAQNGIPPYTWSVSSGNLPTGLTLNPSTGLISGTATGKGATFTIRVSDQTVLTASRTYTLDFQLQLSPTTLPAGQVGTNYSQSLSVTGGSGSFTCSLYQSTAPPGLILNSQCQISGNPTTAGSFPFTVQVADGADGQILTQPYTVVIVPPPLIVTTASPLPTTEMGAVSIPLAATGGTPPYQWAATAGSLPPGVSLSTAGVVTGTATAAGNFTFTATVTDSAKVTTPKIFTITIAPPVSIITQSLGAIPPNGAYFASLAAQNGIPPYTWSVASGSLPAGLNLNPSTGLISGTASGTGSTFTIKVTDKAGYTDARTYTIDPPLQLSATTLPAGRVAIGYLQYLGVTGGSGSYNCFVTKGITPPALLLNSQQCDITGTPSTAGSFPFTVQVTDADGQTITQSYTIVINPPFLIVATTSLADTPMGAISIPLTASGGTPPYKWSVTAGSLPPGASLSTAGVITGAATAQGSFTFTATVTDSANATASKSFTIKILPPLLTIMTGALPDGVGQTAYSAPVSATGGVPPYTWSATGLPSPLTINSATGIISGTPGQPGTFTVTVTVTDSAGGTNTQTFTIRVTVATLKITSLTLPDAVAAVAYTAKLTASGGVLPYTWSAVAPFPAGFALASDGTITGTDPKADALSFPVQVVDAQGTTAAALVALKVAPAPLVISPATLPGGTAGLAYTQSLSATGGVPPFTWTATLPSGLQIDPNKGAISGASLMGGPQTLAVTVTDATGTIAKNTYSVTFAMPPLPAVTFNSVPAVPATQPSLGFSLASPYPLAITGTAALAMKPDGSVSDPAVVFASGKTTLPFTIAAGAGSPAFGAGASFQTGTVSGTITITLSFQSGGLDITPSPAPSLQIRIAPQAPAITSVTATRSAGLLTVAVQGYSVTREVTQANFHLGIAAGASVTPTDFTLPVSSPFASYFQGSSSASTGGQFLFTQTFTVAGDQTQIQSVGVSLTNSVGTSAVVTAQAQ